MSDRLSIVLAVVVLAVVAILGAIQTVIRYGLGFAHALIFNACLVAGGWLIGRYLRRYDR